MKKLQELFDKIQQYKYYSFIVRIFWCLLCTFFFMKMVLNLGYVSETPYQVPRDYYFGIAMCFLLLAYALLQRVNLKNILIYIFMIVYGIVAWRWLKVHETWWGEELQNVFKIKWLCGGILGALVIDMLRYKKIANFKVRNIVGTVLYLGISFGVYFMSSGRLCTYVLILPFLFLYLPHIKERAWNNWIFCLTLGYYLAFAYTMSVSFLTVPYVGDRYYGIYVNHGLFGIYIGGACVCALWWIIVAFQSKKALWIKVLACLAMAFGLICLLLNGARVSEFAVIVVGLLAFCLYGGKAERKYIIRRFVIVLVVSITGILLLVAAIKFLGSYHEDIEIENVVIRENLEYFRNRAYRALQSESLYGLTEPGSFWNFIDRFSSDRISYFIVYLREVGWSGHDDFLFPMGEIIFTHPHNTFIYWLYGLGILPGALLMVLVLYYTCLAFIKCIRKKNHFILPLFWVVYFITVSLNEDVLWNYITSGILLVLQYPLLVEFQKGEE